MEDSVSSVVLEVVYQLRRVGPPSTVQNSASLIRLQEDGEVTVGRGPAATFYVDSAVTLRLISRIHATIKGERVPGGHPRFTIISSGLNGTYINDRKMGNYPENQQVLLEGDRITFGHPGCSAIQPGEYAPQLDSEFQFIFECVRASRLGHCGDRYRNHGKCLPLSGKLRHYHLQKHSPLFNATCPRVSDSPLSNASTSEKENEVTNLVCQDVQNILSDGVSSQSPSSKYHVQENCHLDSKLSKLINNGQNTNHVLSLENNKKVSGVSLGDVLSDPVFPLDNSDPNLSFYEANGDLTLCNPSEFLSYSDIVKTCKSLDSPHGEPWDVNEGENNAVPSSHVQGLSQPQLQSQHETYPSDSLTQSFAKPSGETFNGIEVNSTVIILGDEVDDEDDDDDEDDNVDGDDDIRHSDHACDGSSVEFISESGPTLPAGVIDKPETEQLNGSSSAQNEDVNVADMEFPDNAEVNFGIEDIIEVTVTTENAIDSVNEDSNGSSSAGKDADCDSDSMPSLKSIKDGVQLGDFESGDSGDSMPPLLLMNDLCKAHTSEVNENVSGLSYDDVDIPLKDLHTKQGDIRAAITSKELSSSLEQASSFELSKGSENLQSLTGLSKELINSQFEHGNVNKQSVICMSGDFRSAKKSKKSLTAKPPTGKRADSEHRSEFTKSKTVSQVDCTSQCVVSAKSSKTCKENGDTKSDSGDLFTQSKKKPVPVANSAALCDAALKLKSVCSEVVSKSPLSSLSSKSPSPYLFQSKSSYSNVITAKSPASYLFTSKSPPSFIPQLLTPSSNSPQSRSPLSDLCQSKSPLYFAALKTSDLHYPELPTQSLSPSKSKSLSPEDLSTAPVLSNAAPLPRATSPVTNTTTIILSSGSDRRGKSSRGHEKSRKHKSSSLKQSSASSSSSRPSSRSSNHSTSSDASLSNSSLPSSAAATTSKSPDVSSSKSRSSSGGSVAHSISSESSSHSRPPLGSAEHSRKSSGSIEHSRTSSGSSSKSRLSSKHSSQNSVQSLRSTDKTFFKDTVPNLYSSSDEGDTVQENKTEIVKKIYSPKGKQEDAAGKVKVPRRNSSSKTHKQSGPASAFTSSAKPSTAVTPKQVPPQHESAKSLCRVIRDLSPASSVSSDISDVSGMDKKPKTQQWPKTEKKPESKPVELPQVSVKPKTVALTQAVMQLNTTKPKPSASKQVSSPPVSLTSLPWMSDASAPKDTYRKTSIKKTTPNQRSINQKNGCSAVSNNKSTISSPRVGGFDSSVKGSPLTRGSSTNVSKTVLCPSEVKTDRKSLSNSSGHTQVKSTSVRDKVDSYSNTTTAKTHSTGSVSKDKGSTSASGKTDTARKATDLKRSNTKVTKPDDPQTDPASNRRKRTRSHQGGSSRLKTDFESSDSEDEPASKRRDLRPEASRSASQSTPRSLRTPRSTRIDKPEMQTERTAGTRKRKQTDSLPSKTSASKGNSKKASASKKGKTSKTKGRKRKRIADSSSDDDDNNDDDDDEDDFDDLLESESEASESWDLPDGVQYYDNLCSAKKCLNPEGKTVDWVMCDHCEQWYHVVCVNCPADVLKEDAQFHCGFC